MKLTTEQCNRFYEDGYLFNKHKTNVEYYKNFHTKPLRHKMSMIDQYNINFKKCEKEFQQNPLSFRAEYE